MAILPLLLEEATREEVRAIAGEALALLPVGATEQHGPHLPVGTDAIIVRTLARAVAAEMAEHLPVLVTPTLPFGSSQHHLPFGGTMSLSTEVYFRVVYDLVESLIIGGFRRIFILNGHGGNKELVQLVARDLAVKYPVHVAVASFWIVAEEAVAERGTQLFNQSGGHAGALETSLMLALRPELVREPLPHRPQTDENAQHTVGRSYRVEMHGQWQSIDGFTDDPASANADLGKTYLSVAGSAVAKALMEFYAMTNEQP